MSQSIAPGEVHNLLASWWYDYDEANLERWPIYFTADICYHSRSDSGTSRYEHVVSADHHGRERVMADLGRHRKEGVYPLRHFCSNVQLIAVRESEADFRSYLLVTQVVNEQASCIASGRCSGTARKTDGALQFAKMKLVFDLTDSAPINSNSGATEATPSHARA